jgi:plastocyanin
MSPTRATLLGVAAAISVFLAGPPESPSAGEAAAVQAAAGPTAVRIDNFNFTPPTLVVAPGTTVTWTNADDDVHTVVEKDRKFKSAALDTNDTFSQTFTAPGEYEYFCSLHPRMVGKIVVKPEGKTSSN